LKLSWHFKVELCSEKVFFQFYLLSIFIGARNIIKNWKDKKFFIAALALLMPLPWYPIDGYIYCVCVCVCVCVCQWSCCKGERMKKQLRKGENVNVHSPYLCLSVCHSVCVFYPSHVLEGKHWISLIFAVVSLSVSQSHTHFIHLI
jgi:hypothetical protein